MTFQLICTAIIALIIGVLALVAGYRLFLILLPIWGFFAGFAMGTHATALLFGMGFLATVTSWIIGIVVGLIFAVLSYLIYIVGVALLSAAFGYFLPGVEHTPSSLSLLKVVDILRKASK